MIISHRLANQLEELRIIDSQLLRFGWLAGYPSAQPLGLPRRNRLELRQSNTTQRRLRASSTPPSRLLGLCMKLDKPLIEPLIDSLQPQLVLLPDISRTIFPLGVECSLARELMNRTSEYMDQVIAPDSGLMNIGHQVFFTHHESLEFRRILEVTVYRSTSPKPSTFRNSGRSLNRSSRPKTTTRTPSAMNAFRIS